MKKENMKITIAKYLGWNLANNVADVKINSPHIIFIGDDRCIITCYEKDKPYIEAMADIAGYLQDDVKYVVKQKGERPAAGKGFGDRVWRENSKHSGIEISFANRPDEKFRDALKSLGFRWSRMSGVWYLPTKKMTDGVAVFLANNAFTKVEGA